MRLLLCALFLVACGAGPNTAYLPVGSRCTTSADCGTTPYDCDTSVPGGYCERACSLDADCPMDAICGSAGHCRRKCDLNSECRESEGYICGDVGNSLRLSGCRLSTRM